MQRTALKNKGGIFPLFFGTLFPCSASQPFGLLLRDLIVATAFVCRANTRTGTDTDTYTHEYNTQEVGICAVESRHVQMPWGASFMTRFYLEDRPLSVC